MATATEVDLSSMGFIKVARIVKVDQVPRNDACSLEKSADQWAQLLREGFEASRQGKVINPHCLTAPRRRHADPNSAALALSIANLLYPSYADSSIAQVIKYEKDIKAEELARAAAREQPSWKRRILNQGPWDEENDPLSLDGAPSLPMPVTISDRESLAPIFNHLSVGGTYNTVNAAYGKEPYYNTLFAEFEKGLLYEDGRLDLCKMVLGPPSISHLMNSLTNNSFVRHFLLGNNMIGPIGARVIAEWVQNHPNKIQTWYLAGNCIDIAGFDRLVGSWTRSTFITNIWLKRNPLGPDSAPLLYRLITKSPVLGTLDLDQTELGNEGLSQLFELLKAAKDPSLPLRNLFLNAVGVGPSACQSIAAYLSSPECKLQSLYLSNNPIGDSGATALAAGLKSNTSLLRLTLASVGMKTAGAKEIFSAAEGHSQLITLDVSQNYAVNDLGMRYSFIKDDAVEALMKLVRLGTLEMLNLGTNAITPGALSSVAEEVAKSKTLLVLNAKSAYGKVWPEVKASVKDRIKDNIQREHEMSVEDFDAEEKRWLVSPKDVRFIDSGYRNRDAGLALRGQLRLKKWWEDGMETVDSVMHADDAQDLT